ITGLCLPCIFLSIRPYPYLKLQENQNKTQESVSIPTTNMKFAIAILSLAATLAVAFPPNSTAIRRSSINASIQYFSRWDCQNPCVETGICLGGQTDEGDVSTEENQTDWIGWDAGCWDV